VFRTARRECLDHILVLGLIAQAIAGFRALQDSEFVLWEGASWVRCLVLGPRSVFAVAAGRLLLLPQVPVEPLEDDLESHHAVPGTARPRQLVTLAWEPNKLDLSLVGSKVDEQLLGLPHRASVILLRVDDQQGRGDVFGVAPGGDSQVGLGRLPDVCPRTRPPGARRRRHHRAGATARRTRAGTGADPRASSIAPTVTGTTGWLSRVEAVSRRCPPRGQCGASSLKAHSEPLFKDSEKCP
jgi:hypothetical protein